jgi:hypothetical protein
MLITPPSTPKIAVSENQDMFRIKFYHPLIDQEASGEQVETIITMCYVTKSEGDFVHVYWVVSLSNFSKNRKVIGSTFINPVNDLILKQLWPFLIEKYRDAAKRIYHWRIQEAYYHPERG